MHDGPIGVFDSGLGGLTVLQALADLLPHEDLVYFGDTARYPYGDRTAPELRRFSDQIADLLVAAGAKMLVVACNSATAAALEPLRARLTVPVIGVVEPGLRAAAKVSRSRRTVVIGTRMTAASGIYERTAAGLDLALDLEVLACPGFVELVEEGRTDTPEAVRVVHDRLAPLLRARTDTLVLGCTHYPLLARAIGRVVGRHVTLVSSADETAFEVRDLLQRTGWLSQRRRDGRRTFVTSGSPSRFAELGQRFLGTPLDDVRGHVWDVTGRRVSA
ncbi:glutamate racemase [Egicoccus halophilus]|uniref:Glutamate racemase n=1 Tax=Egicoccus halophilus TaxID=1670830 RepID=A0A8J3AA98_9ACTN|nr:glutamate racemase [Egicoccus halophilus]GGI06320.1 glutamate racemase [Egicoccus halophilus]